ncbi:hypothetical protein [Salinilacihabitans rarus]|uniref:hypothetical protein n=1 Tax=Salinilacihabitans rarus TaxID=2961596 RepID=UPI0020C91821|nr:hypothetical protein [Salinilacihabitans rarus]
MPARTDDGTDRPLLAADRYSLTALVGAFVPAALARRAVSVSVETDRDSYAVGDPVEVSVTFRNRLPVPVAVPTPERRLWGWCVGGELEASDERRYTRPEPAEFAFRPGETKRVTFVWSGRFERTGDDHESVLPDPGEYEIAAFVATADRRPRDATTVTLR